LSTSAPDAVTITSAPAGGRIFKRARKVRQFMAHHSMEQIEHWLTHERNEGRDDRDRDDRGRGKDDKDKGKGGGSSKTPPVVDAAELDAFDQTTLDDRFRTNAYPTMAVDNQGRVYLAWTERGFAGLNNSQTLGDARVVMATSLDGVSWRDPQMVEDPVGATSTGVGPLPGHQLMPSLAFAGGKLTLAFYDLREDTSAEFGPWVDENDAIAASRRRHTIDIRATQADPGDAPQFAPSVRVSQYQIGSRRGSGEIEQLQFNAPNLPLFQLGTVPFIGDYIDLAPSPAFLVDSRGRWRYNVAPSTSTVFHLAWTDNRDVRKPADGDWTKYTPPLNPFSAQACDAGFTASRNQNVYTSKLTQGLLAGSPGNTKTLSPTLPRGFVVFAQNTTDLKKTFRLTILGQPVGGRASFNQLASTGLLLQVDATVPARSTVSRTVYLTSTDPKASVPVDISEVSGPAGTPLAGGLKATVVLNPDIANPDIANPDIANPDIANPDIANTEVYNPDIANPDIANPDIANPDIANPDIANPDIANPDIANPDIANPDIANPDIANPDIANPDIANPDIANPDIANGALTDVTWAITNTGNTTATFDVDLFFKNQNVPGGIKTQLILYRVYKTPESSSGAGCDTKLKTQNVLVANILNPVFKAPGSPLTPDPANPSEKNATMWIEPGGTARITLRIVDKNVGDNETFDPVNDVKPVVTSEAYNTPDVAGGTLPATPPPSTEPPTGSVPSLQFATQPVGVAPGLPMQSFSVQYFASPGNPGGGGVPVTIALASNPGGGVLVGPTTLITNSSGVATFTGVAISSPGIGYRIAASSAASNAIPVISAPLNTGKLPAIVSVGTDTVVFDGHPHTVPVTVDQGGLPVIVTYEGGPPPTNAGVYHVVAAVDSPTYEGVGAGTLTITKATPVLTWGAPAPIALGTPLGGAQLNATATLGGNPVAGTFAYAPAGGTVLNAGLSQPLSLAFTPAEIGNFNVPAPAATTIDVIGLVSRWQADGDTNDSTGNAYNGTLTDGATFAAGKTGLAFNFDNKLPGDRQHVVIGSQPHLKVRSAMTMAAWIYPTSNGVYSGDWFGIGQGGIIVNKEGEYEVARFADGNIWWAFANTDPGYTWTNTHVQAPLNTWTHVAITYDAVAGKIKAYINGTLVQTYIGNGNIGVIGDYAGFPGLDEVWIGGRQETNDTQFFDGRIDDVAIYNRALTQAEVQALMAPPAQTAWSASGSGTTTLHNDNSAAGQPAFQHQDNGDHLVPGSPGDAAWPYDGTWEYSTAAADTRSVNLGWSRNGVHTYPGVYARLEIPVNRGGVDVHSSPLMSYGPVYDGSTQSDAFSHSGATVVSVQAGDAYGFRLAGGHHDRGEWLQGTFSGIVDGVVEPAPSATAVSAAPGAFPATRP
jgi:hypothetical protein